MGRPDRHARGALRRRRVGRRQRRGSRHARRARPARRVLHQRQHGAGEGRRALAPHQLPAELPQPPRRPLRRDRVHVPAVPHVRVVHDAQRLADAVPDPLRDDPRRGHDPRRPPNAGARRASYCLPAVWARILEHDRSAYDLSSVRECDTGTSATPPELLAAIKDAFPDTITRVYYGSTECGPAALLGDADLARKPGSGRPPTADGLAPPLRRRRGVRAQPLPHGRLLRAAGGDRRCPAADGARRARLVLHGRPRRDRRRGLPVDRRSRPRRAAQRRRDRRAR